MFNSSECVRYFEILACGLACSPAQYQFIRISQSPGGNSTTNVTRIFNVCPAFADELYQACRSVPMGSGLTVESVFATPEAFLRLNTVSDRFAQVVNATDCFDGLRVRTKGAYSYVLENNTQIGLPGYGLSHIQVVQTRAGDLEDFTLQAVDIFKNPRQLSDDSWLLNVVGVPNERKNVTLLSSTKSAGQYHYSYSVTLASQQPYQFLIRNNNTDDDLVLFSPFSILVTPGDIYGNNTIVGPIATPIVVNTLQTFSLTARDRYGNLLLNGGNSTFFTFNFLNASDLSEVNVTKMSFTVTDNCDGTYTVSYVAPPQKGVYILEVFSFDNDNGFVPILIESTVVTVVNDCKPDPDCSNNGDCVNGTCQCRPGWTGPDCASRTVCIPCSIAYGKGLSTSLVFEDTGFTIQSNDADGHRVFYGGLTWTVEAFWNGIKLNTTFTIVDRQNGLYDVAFTPNVVGTVQIRVTLNGTDITDSPFTVLWIGPPCPGNCCGHGICYFDRLTSTSTCQCVSDVFNLDSCCSPSLRVSQVVFSDIGVAVVVQFNAPTNMAGMIGIDNCSEVLAETDLFGEGAYCVWPSADVLYIWLGSYARVEIGDFVVLKNVIVSAAGSIPLASPGQLTIRYPIGPAPKPIPPLPFIHAPLHISACADLVLDGRPSLGTAGRAMHYDWDIVPGPTNWRAVQQFLRTLTADSAVMPADYVRDTFAEGEEYLFTLNVTNHLGLTSAQLAYYSVSFTFDPVPTVSVVPMHRQRVLSTRVSRSVKLHGAAITSGCAVSFLEPRDELQFSWIQIDGPAFQVNNYTSNTPLLFMPPGSLQANQNYTVNLRAQHATYTSFLGETQVALTVLPTAPFTEIGGSLRAFALTRDPDIDLVLDASESVDFDQLDGDFTYTWSCVNTATKEDCWDEATSEHYLFDSPSLVIPSYEIPLGEFRFTVTVQKEGGLSASASVLVQTISRGPAVEAELVGLTSNDNVVNGNNKIILSARALSAVTDPEESGLRWKWSVVSGPMLDSDLEQVLESSRYLPNLVIRANTLGADQHYVFRVEATDAAGTGYALVPVVIHPRPAAGSCQLFVNNSRQITGEEEAYVHEFSILCNYWEDRFTEGEVPLRYRFFAEPVGSGGKRFPLASGLSDRPSVSFLLPPGSARLHVEVLDQTGVSASFQLSASAKLTERERLLMNDEDLAEWVRNNVLQPAIDSANMAIVGQAIQFITDILNRHPNMTQAVRDVEDEIARVERDMAAATEELADAQIQQYQRLRDKRTSLSTQLDTRTRLWANLVETLLFDYAVEYDVYTVVQRLGYVTLLARGGTELTDEQVHTLITLFVELHDRLAGFLGPRRRSSGIQQESVQAFLDAYSELNLAVLRGGRSLAFRQSARARLLDAFAAFAQRESLGLVSGEVDAAYQSDYFRRLTWGKSFVSLLVGQDLVGAQSTAAVSNAALAQLAQGGAVIPEPLPSPAPPEAKRQEPQLLQPQLAQDEPELQFVFAEFQSNIFAGLSSSAANISTPVVGLRYYDADGQELQVNVTGAVTLTLPVLALPSSVARRAALWRRDGEDDSSNSSVIDSPALLLGFKPTCLVWDDAAQAFSSSFCSVGSFTFEAIQCVCSRLGEFGASLEVIGTIVSPSPSPSSRPIIRAAERDWLPMDQIVLLVIFVVVMGVVLFLAVVWVYWRHKHEVPMDIGEVLIKWEAAAEDEQQTAAAVVQQAPPVLPELEDEEDDWVPDPYYYPEDYYSGEEEAPPDEDEEDNLDLAEWTGNRGQTRLTRIAQGAGERGVYAVTSTKRQPGYTNLTFQMGPRLKRSESLRSASGSLVKKKELQAKASINIQSQSSSKRGQV